MGSSSLQRTGEKPPIVKKGHGTDALGPSDSSDTGSDVTGAPGLNEEDDTLHLQQGTTSDADHNARRRRKTAGPDIGDENLDSDTDAEGTGERAAAGRDAPPPTDQQLNIVDVAGAGSEVMSDEDLDQELAEEDRETDKE